MLTLLPKAMVFTFTILALAGPQTLPAMRHSQSRTAASILAQVRKATGGDAWNRVAELRVKGVLLTDGRTGTIATVDDLRTGANADRVDLQDTGRVENQADMPAQKWEQDSAGDILLMPGGKEPGDIDDLYVHRNGWWEPHFGGASVTLLPAATEEGVTYERLQCSVPGGNGFTLWIDRSIYHVDRIIRGDSVTYFSNFRRTESGLLLPFRQQKGTGKQAVVFTTTELTTLPRLNEADFQPPFRTDYSMPASNQVTVPAEGGLVFKMKVNGQGSFPTVFDTGAVNIISATFARQLGLKVEEAPVHFGAIGSPITVHTAHVNTLAIGDLTIRDQTFYVLDIPSESGEPQMLVGWELMRRFAVRVDFEHNQLTFFNGPQFHYTGTGTAIPLLLHKNGNGVDVRAEADGIPGTYLLDSGNQLGFFLNSGFVEEHHLIAALQAHYRGFNGKGFGGPSPEAWFARLHTLRIGDYTIPNPVVRLQTAPDGPDALAGNIGQSILNRFTLTVDCMRGVMYLEKNGNWNKAEVFNRAGLVLDFTEGVDQVMTVLPGSPGEKAGLKVGDSLTAIDGQPPGNDPNDPAFTQPAGTVLRLTVRRNGAVHLYEVTLADVL